jgi:hypothetical protein
MKNLVFVLIIIIQVLNSTFGQNTFAPMGAKWIYTEPKIFNLFEGPKYFEITGMDTIGGKVCSRITYDTSFMGDVTHFYQDNNKIYFRVKNSEVDTFLLFFDQSATVNDTIDIGVRNAPYYDYNANDSIPFFSMKIVIDSIKTEEVDNKSIKVWYLSTVSIFTPYTCHEIGSKYYENVGYNHIFLPYFECLDPGIEFDLRCYEDPVTSIKFVDYPCDYHSKTKDHQLNNAIVIYPNPANNEINISIPHGFNIEKTEIFNALGRRVFASSDENEVINISDLESGIYLVLMQDYNGSILSGKFVRGR